MSTHISPRYSRRFKVIAVPSRSVQIPYVRHVTAKLLAAFVLAVLLNPWSASGATLSWTGTTDTDFNTSGNWSPAQVPTAGDQLLFNKVGTNTVSFAGNGASGEVRVLNGTFDFNLGSSTWSTAAFELAYNNSATLVPVATITGGTVSASGALRLGAFANSVNGSLTLAGGNTFTSTGLATVGREGKNNTFTVSDGSVFSSAGLSLSTVAGGGSNTVVVSGAGSVFNSSGTVSVSVVASTGNVLRVTNGGVLNISNSGQLRVGDGTGSAGNSLLVSGAGSTINLGTGTTVGVALGTSQSNNSLTVADGGFLQATSATLTVLSSGGGNLFRVDGGTANLLGLTAQFNTVDVRAGELNVSGTILNTGNNVFDFSGGTIRAGAANFNTGALTVGDGSGVAAGYVLTGNGTHGIGSVLTVQSDGSVSGNGVIAASTNGSTATAVLNSGTISAGSGQTLRVVGSMTNQGGSTLSVSNGGVFIASAASTNAGTINIGSGSAATFSNGLSSAGAINVNGTLTGGTTIASGGILSGSGTMASAVTISGTLAIGNSPGTMTFEDNLTLDLNSTSIFEIDAFTPGQFDLAQGGAGTQTVTFGGTLELAFANGFNSLGTVKIFDFENYSGAFGATNVSGLASGFTATFNELDGVVTVVPEPSTYALLALAGAGLAGHVIRRRRRS